MPRLPRRRFHDFLGTSPPPQEARVPTRIPIQSRSGIGITLTLKDPASRPWMALLLLLPSADVACPRRRAPARSPFPDGSPRPSEMDGCTFLLPSSFAPHLSRGVPVNFPALRPGLTERRGLGLGGGEEKRRKEKIER